MDSPSPTIISTASAVEATLADPRLEPPPPTSLLGRGATARLRNSMARFSGADCHGVRRHTVVELIDSLDNAAVRATASTLTADLLGGRATLDAVSELAFRVPTETMLRVLDIPHDPRKAVADVKAMVEVIGRGAVANDRSDAAVERLLVSCSSHPAGTVPVVSALYQTFDATAALFVESLLATHRRIERAPAVRRTVRVAAADAIVDGVALPAGSTVVLDLGAAGFEFGAGNHQCPGRAVAEAIVGGITSAITTAGFVVVDVSESVDANHRPDRIDIAPRS